MKILHKSLFLSMFFVFLLTCIFSLFSKTPSYAQSYPIKELGNCSSQKSCFSYCEEQHHIPTCWSYGKYILHKQVLGEQTTSDEEFKKKYQLVFPITELGNCNNVAECKTYCDNKDHQDTCIAFSKKKGFYKEPPKISKEQSASESARQTALIQAAKQQLGCNSMDECRALCQNPDNKTKCEAFAKNNGLSKPPVSQQNITDLVQKAKTELGCTSQDSCRVYCEQNKEKCAVFTQKNMSQNQELNTKEDDSSKKTENTSEFPSNCKDSEECRIRYCQKYPSHCPGFPRNQEPTPSGQVRKPVKEQQYRTQSLETTSYPKPTQYNVSGTSNTKNSQQVYPSNYQQQSQQNTSLYPSSTSGN